MKMFVFVFILSALVAVGQSKVDGPCPIKIKQIRPLDAVKYSGKWFDIYASPREFECANGYGCQVTYYRGYDDTYHSWSIDYYTGKTYRNVCAYGVWQTDYDVDAHLLYAANDDIVYILDTDYDSYAVEIGCSNDDGLTHDEIVILRSRNMTMSDDVRDKLVKQVVDYGFADPQLSVHDYTGCKDFDPK